MNFVKKHRLTPLALLTGLFSVTPLMAATLTPADTVDYDDCIAKVAIQSAGKQKNDECFIHFDKFISIANPTTKTTKVYIDESHNNFHKKDERYLPFTRLLKKDNYTVGSITSNFLGFIQDPVNANAIIVIANPVHASNDPEANWIAPIQSAFTDAEIIALDKWVRDGGKLMLIADHFPFPGAMDALAKKFGFYMDNGYHFDPNYNDVFLYDMLNRKLSKDIMQLKLKTKDIAPAPYNDADGDGVHDLNKDGEKKTVKDVLVDEVRAVMVALGAEVNSLVFWSGTQPTYDSGLAEGDGWLIDHPITRGLNANESIPYATSFTGQSFTYIKPDNTHKPITELMRIGKDTYSLLTDSQDAYFGNSQTESEDNLVISVLTYQKVPTFTVAKKDTSPIGEKYTLQGAAVEIGDNKGKVVVFGEAGMFTAQIAADGKSQMGFNNPMAKYNQQFVLNTVRWLDGQLTDTTNITPAINSGLTRDLLPVSKKIAAKVDAIEVYKAAQKLGVVNPMTFAKQHVGITIDANGNDVYPSYNEATKLSQMNEATIDAAVASASKYYAEEYKNNYDGTDSFGCSMSTGNGRFDPTLLLLTMFALGYIFIPRKQRAI